MISSSSSRLMASDEIRSSPDLTPMLDVIFMLLVFFMLTANRVEQALTIDLPEKGSEQATPLEQQETITLTLFPEPDHWGVNNSEFYDWFAVKRAITKAQSQHTEARFLIAADRHVSIERLLQVLGYFKSQGIAVADILMQTNSRTFTEGKHL